MAKRMIDTEIFQKKWVKSLSSKNKLLYIYLFTNCNHAGIWDVELDVASARLKAEYDEEEVLRDFGDEIIPIDDGEKWFISGFVEFQYGELNPENRVHNSVLKLIEKHNLHTQGHKPLGRPLEGSTEGAKDKDKDKDKYISNIERVSRRAKKNSLVPVPKLVEVAKEFYREQSALADQQLAEGKTSQSVRAAYRRFCNYLFGFDEGEESSQKPTVWLNLENQMTFTNFVKLMKKAGSIEQILAKVDLAINKPKYLRDNTDVYRTISTYLQNDLS